MLRTSFRPFSFALADWSWYVEPGSSSRLQDGSDSSAHRQIENSSSVEAVDAGTSQTRLHPDPFLLRQAALRQPSSPEDREFEIRSLLQSLPARQVRPSVRKGDPGRRHWRYGSEREVRDERGASDRVFGQGAQWEDWCAGEGGRGPASSVSAWVGGHDQVAGLSEEVVQCIDTNVKCYNSTVNRVQKRCFKIHPLASLLSSPTPLDRPNPSHQGASCRTTAAQNKSVLRMDE